MFWLDNSAISTLIFKSLGFWLLSTIGATYLGIKGYELRIFELTADFWLSSLFKYCDVVILYLLSGGIIFCLFSDANIFYLPILLVTSSTFSLLNEKFDSLSNTSGPSTALLSGGGNILLGFYNWFVTEFDLFILFCCWMLPSALPPCRLLGVYIVFIRVGELILFLSRPSDLISPFSEPFALRSSSKSRCVLEPSFRGMNPWCGFRFDWKDMYSLKLWQKFTWMMIGQVRLHASKIT